MENSRSAGKLWFQVAIFKTRGRFPLQGHCRASHGRAPATLSREEKPPGGLVKDGVAAYIFSGMARARSFSVAWQHFSRALRLRCPVCGKSPIFIPWRRVRNLRDWLTPLDGCPRCGYPYEREPGYFLLAIWAVNYTLGSLLGLVLYGILEWTLDLPVWGLLAAVLAPVFLFCLVFARQSKALFLAFDLFFDPHERGGEDDGGNRPVRPVDPPQDRPAGKPCDPAARMP